jgi:hypothetical protein
LKDERKKESNSKREGRDNETNRNKRESSRDEERRDRRDGKNDNKSVIISKSDKEM